MFLRIFLLASLMLVSATAYSNNCEAGLGICAACDQSACTDQCLWNDNKSNAVALMTASAEGHKHEDEHED